MTLPLQRPYQNVRFFWWRQVLGLPAGEADLAQALLRPSGRKSGPGLGA